MKGIRLGIFLMSLWGIFYFATGAFAATKYWVGSAGGNFTTDSNWSTTNGSSCGANQNTTAPGSSDVATFNSTCTNSASLDATVSVSGVDINTGYTGVITQAAGTTLTVGAGNYDQAAGEFAGSGTGTFTVASNGTFTLSSGTFTTAGTNNFERNFTISGGTFNNSATLTFNEVGGFDNTTLTCSGTIPGTVAINKGGDTTTFTLSSNCTIDLGTGPTTTMGTANNGAASLTNNGTINVAGTWTANGASNIVNNGTITHSGSGWDMEGGLINNSGASITYSGTALSIERSFTQSGTFSLSGKTITLDGSGSSDHATVTCSGTLGGTIGSISKAGTALITIANGCTVDFGTSPTMTLGGGFTNEGTINVAGTWTVTQAPITNNGTITHSGTGWDFNDSGLVNNSGATITFSGTAITIERNFTQDGTFNLSGVTITFDGGGSNDASNISCAQTINGNVTINKSSIAATTLAGNCTISGNFTRTDGPFTNPSSSYTLTLQGNFSMATTDTFGGSNFNMAFTGSGTQTITQSAGTASSTISINKSGGTASLTTAFSTVSQTCDIVEGAFSLAGFGFTCGSTFTVQDGGNLQLQGAESVTSPTLSSGSTVTFTGNGNSGANTYTITTYATTFHHLTINSTDGTTDTFQPAAALDVNGTFTLTNGTFTANSNNITVGGNWVKSGGTYTASSRTVTLDGSIQTVSGSTTFYNLTKSETASSTLSFSAGGTTTVTNTLTLNGAASNLLVLHSTADGSQWSVDPQGTRSVSYVAVKDSNNTNATALSCTNNCTNSGNNTNWSFNVAPDTPSSLGPTSYVNGSYVASSTPNLTFTQSDSDAGNTLAFRIQIDDSSDFSSAVADYTSASVAQGATSFTVGQAAGSGSYTTGAAGQTLSDGSYYWRVRSTDGIDTSSYATANSGAVAFIVDVTAPSPQTFSSNPTAQSTSAISMTATTASDGGEGTVQYQFEETTSRAGANSSGWQSSASYTDSSLSPCTDYSYQVRVRDGLSNTSSYSSSVTVKTNCLGGGAAGSSAPIALPVLQPQPSTLPTTAPVRANGTLFKYDTSPRVFVLENGIRRWIADAYTFNLYGYRWEDIVVIPESELYAEGAPIAAAPPPTERLIKYQDSPRVYLLKNDTKYWIVDENTFRALGYRFTDIQVESPQQRYRSGLPIMLEN